MFDIIREMIRKNNYLIRILFMKEYTGQTGGNKDFKIYEVKEGKRKMSIEINSSKTINQLFESCKARYNEETPLSEGQDMALSELEKVTLASPSFGQAAFDKAIALSRESEKAGFALGFRMAISLMSECLG